MSADSPSAGGPASLTPHLERVRGPRGPVGYERWGAAGAPLLLLAGLGSCARLWGDLPRLLARRFTVLAPDNRGVGRSREGEQFTLAGAAEDAALVIGHAGFQSAAVLGVSMGGLIACHMAGTRPGQVSRLVAASCGASLTSSHRRVLRFFELCLTRMAPAEAAASLMTFTFAPGFADRYPGFVDQAAALWAPDPDDVPGALAQVRHLAEGWDLRQVAAAIACPTLVLAGQLDPLVPVAATRDLAATIPGARCREVPGAAHSVLAEGGPALLDEVLEFLAP
ncbi:MAG: alpha/beta fold hydrolase [Acidobacteriota bacterium]